MGWTGLPVTKAWASLNAKIAQRQGEICDKLDPGPRGRLQINMCSLNAGIKGHLDEIRPQKPRWLAGPLFLGRTQGVKI